MKNYLIAAVALMAGTAALAQTPPVAPPAPAAPMAPMADKTMTRDEMVAMVREHFGRLDTDKNGSITTDEVMKGHEDMAGRGREMWRERGDPKEAFDRLDSNKDGSISRDEFTKGRQERFEQRIVLREQGKDGKPGDKQALRMHHMGGMGGGRMIVMADTDHDGKITLAEAQAKALEHFDQMDANHDGQVTPEERRAARQLMIEKVIVDKKTAS